jgi:hypothetical protein
MVLVATIVVAHSRAQSPADWPQWRGPQRSGVSQETGLLQQWPASGPVVAWATASLGAGYGSVAVSGPHVY